MRFYIVLALLVGGLVGGYHLSETYRELNDFHHRYLEGGPNLSMNHTTMPPVR